MIRKLALGITSAASLGFVGVTGLLYTYQRDLIYPVPEVDRSVPAGFQRISYTTEDGLTLSSGYRPARPGMPTLLFFHGNSIDWQSAQHTTELAVARGYGVLAAEYRGYGGNPGSPSEAGLYADGRAAFAWLLAQGIPAQQIVLVGNSLGSGVATELAATARARALILISPFMSMTATAANKYPFAPVDSLLADRFENVAKIGRVAMPVLVVHGADDGLIPLDHARQLAAANPAAQLVVLPGQGHNMAGKAEAQVPQLAFLAALER
ncbi:alpha/beta hydrolase [Alteraurantiacibacter buctensis]|uniref:Alpha/beta fold hydrolase n=1 Tax=Alteraurantiacibacter buctensis TaxID=1503981 RepID=A0A844YWH8_9SPHN|nr:alpha/beta hydrolase [Alteraurantiacibacter buctensis]MXO70427.1 alpha/beta fold hydrolase [Alteraurantiacibacter buctensis]